MTSDAVSKRRSAATRLLDGVERIGNRLPDQSTLFILLAGLTLFGSWLAAGYGLAVEHPVTKERVAAVSLVSREGFQWILGSAVSNFTGFAPLGTVLVAMIGIGVAERSGLFAAMLKLIVISVPRRAVTPTIIFAGMLSHVAADAGFIILPPLAAMIFAAVGRNPLAGVAAAFAGVGAGFSANVLMSALDPLLAGITQDAARLFDNAYTVNAAANYFFMCASVFLLTGVGWLISVTVVEPRLGPWRRDANVAAARLELAPLTYGERRGLIVAGLTALASAAALALMTVPEGGLLRDPETGGFAPFFSSLVALIMLVFILPGLAYGIATGQIRSDRDAARMMSETMAAMGAYIVMAFFAGQFIAWFARSKLGFIIAIEGANFLRTIHFTGMPLMISFVVVIAVFNLLMSSASAKWAIIGPIFVPMLMAVGISPEATQSFYRVGDSVTNVITPLNVYLPIVLMAAQRYVPTAGLGTLIAAMLPYSLGFLIAWTMFVAAWVSLGIPLGPDSPLTYPG